MEVKAPVKAIGGAKWPKHVGVDGVSVHAASTADISAGRAVAALRCWLPGLDDRSDAGLIAAMRPERFPFTEVLAHYRSAGRAQVASGLLVRLDYLNELLRINSPTMVRRLWPLPQWLPSTVDQLDGDYDSYLVARLLESLATVDDSHPGLGETSDAEVEAHTDRTIDALLATLAADLALVEAEALRFGRPSRQQRQRTQACLRVLSGIGELAPKWAATAGVRLGSGAVPESDARLAEFVRDLALRVETAVPQPCRQAVELAMLPTTRLHDEQMFIRSIQLFETLYRQVYRCLVRANEAIQRWGVRRACTELADATRRLNMSSALYRVVTTMPKSAFAIIRDHTHGRSAIQSRSYRQIELVCAPRPPSPVADKLPKVEVASPTLQDAFLATAGRLGAADADRLASHLRALGASWRAMKRTHWGITLKIIGTVPGTGGTNGANYLKHAAEIPLFPKLAQPTKDQP